MSLLTNIFGDPHVREVRRLQKRVAEILVFETHATALSDRELQEAFLKLRKRCVDGENLDQLLPECFAYVKEAGHRSLGMRHFDVQLIGGMVLHEGKIAEMKTGEGKTLVATLALALHALSGDGAHLITVNDYLARRDVIWMGPIYHALGLTVGCVQSDRQSFAFDPSVESDNASYQHLRACTRQEAYLADITYGTNNEFGFDYLRDNMSQSVDAKVQRSLAYAIVDEVDSILIDEARTPLIISGPAQAASRDYQRYAHLVNQLVENDDYNVDEKQRAATLTRTGIEKMEVALGVENIYDVAGVTMAHHIEQALKAKALFARDRDYLVRSGQVLIVDEFTGRVLEGRRYSEGLHQAIEAKEGVAIKEENVTLATITYQNYFRLYKVLSGMTGTAATEAEEFAKIYNLDVVVIPTHRALIRKDQNDLIYKTAKSKFQAIVQQIEELHRRGQPVLVGTVSVEKSEMLAALLKASNVPHNVLNAKFHEKEAEIVAQAGARGAVTIATNMAGRGTDIVLGGAPRDSANEEEIRKLGGLYVIGTERHEARRIDDQLRGRSGRQGDPGETQFYVSLDDDLMRVFASERIRSMMQTLRLPEDMPIQNGMISKALESAQKRVEGFHFDSRKHLVEYDDVMNTHREVIYKRRNEILRASESENGETRAKVLEAIEHEIDRLVGVHTNGDETESWNMKEIEESLKTMFGLLSGEMLTVSALRKDGAEHETLAMRDAFSTWARGKAVAAYAQLEQRIADPTMMRRIERLLLLRSMDTMWVEHLEQMRHLRESIGLQGYGQRDPLVEYKKESYGMFTQLLENIQHHVVYTIFHVTVEARPRPTEQSPMEREQEHVANDKGADAATPENQIRSEKVGRNDSCPCGSGKKYKKCHGQ